MQITLHTSSINFDVLTEGFQTTIIESWHEICKLTYTENYSLARLLMELNFKRCSDTNKRRVDGVLSLKTSNEKIEDVVAKPETRHQLF